jgi:hypothetical protein
LAFRISKKYRIGLLVLLLLVVLYLLLRSALPQYSARVPLLGIYLLTDFLVFNFVRDASPTLPKPFKVLLIALWWLPVILFISFLLIASFIPLPEWNGFWKVYLPGFALMTMLAKFILFVFLILPLILVIIRRLLRNKLSFSYHYVYFEKFLKRMAIILGSLAFVGLFIGSIHWVSKFKVRELELVIEDLPDALEGKRIVQISDVHLGSWTTTKPIEKAVSMVNELNPDLVLFTGDMVNFSATETKGFEVLRNVRSKYGVYAILGNHDYGDYVKWEDSASKAADFKILENFYKTIGWKLLRNEHKVIEIDSATILLGGVENWSATQRFHRYGDMQKTMKNAPVADVNILMSHDPTHWEAEIIESYPQFDITLSGHTHGMQIGFEGLGLKWSPSQYIYKNWGGLYKRKSSRGIESRLYVNLGLGHIAYPGRVGILPEITLITLTRKN